MRQFVFWLHKENDKKLIDHVEENKPISGYVKSLIEDDYNRNKKD